MMHEMPGMSGMGAWMSGWHWIFPVLFWAVIVLLVLALIKYLLKK